MPVRRDGALLSQVDARTPEKPEETVTVNGETQIEVRDQSITGVNDGFSMVNLGGTWKLDEVTVASASR